VIRAAGLLILNKHGQALFLQRGPGSDYPGMWAFPGGRREGEETAQQTAIRETQEETGFKAKEDQLKFWTRSLRPQEDSPLVTPPQGEQVDFTTFLVRDAEDFTPVLNDEHLGYAWADIGSPPAPLHPGCAVALRRFTMNDELQVAEAIRDGELVSPQEYGNIWLFALRISGVGTAIRGEKKNAEGKVVQKAEVVYRRPEDYNSPEFLRRAQGLPVIIMHPEEAILNTRQYAERSIGAIMITYLRPDENEEMEPWGIARVYDQDAARALTETQLSTSPGVLLGADNTTLTLEGGTQVIVEGKPSLLDHLAICERGVWDKGGDPTGVENIHTRTDGDGEMKIQLKRIEGETEAGYATRVAEAEALLARADSVSKGDEGKLDKLLEGLVGVKDVVAQLKARVDAAEEKERKDAKAKADAFEFPKKDSEESEEEHKEKMDAAEKACKDAMMEAGESEDMAADSAKRRRKDAEEAWEKEKKDAEDIDKKAEEEAKEKKDAEEEEKKAKKDAQTIADLRDELAKLKGQVEGAMRNNNHESRSALLQAQARFDSAYSAHGGQAPAPLLGQTLHEYRMQRLRELQKHSSKYKDKDIGLLAVNDSLLEMAEADIIADAITAARNPTDIAKGTLVMRSRQDGGHTFNEFYGETAAWMRPLAGPVGQRGVRWINPTPGARRG